MLDLLPTCKWCRLKWKQTLFCFYFVAYSHRFSLLISQLQLQHVTSHHLIEAPYCSQLFSWRPFVIHTLQHILSSLPQVLATSITLIADTLLCRVHTSSFTIVRAWTKKKRQSHIIKYIHVLLQKVKRHNEENGEEKERIFHCLQAFLLYFLRD